MQAEQDAFTRFGESSLLLLFNTRALVSSYRSAEVLPEHLLLAALKTPADGPTFPVTSLAPFDGGIPLPDAVERERAISAIEALLPRPEGDVPKSLEVPISDAVSRVLARSHAVADSAGSATILPIHVFIALYEESVGGVARVMDQIGLTAAVLRDAAN